MMLHWLDVMAGDEDVYLGMLPSPACLHKKIHTAVDNLGAGPVIVGIYCSDCLERLDDGMYFGPEGMRSFPMLIGRVDWSKFVDPPIRTPPCRHHYIRVHFDKPLETMLHGETVNGRAKCEDCKEDITDEMIPQGARTGLALPPVILTTEPPVPEALLHSARGKESEGRAAEASSEAEGVHNHETCNRPECDPYRAARVALSRHSGVDPFSDPR